MLYKENRDLVNLYVSKYLDRLIEDYNQKAKILSRYETLTIERSYSEEEKKEEEKDISKFVRSKIKELSEAVEKLQDKISSSAEEAVKTEAKVKNAYMSTLKIRHMCRNIIVSPRTYRKIMSYYRRHKMHRHYSKYKIDNELHNFIMRLGSYLESLDKDIDRRIVRDFSSGYHYYALPSFAILSSGGVKEILGYLSSAVIEAAHIMEIAVHLLVELSPKALHAIPLLPVFLPHFLAGVLAAHLTAGLLIIIGNAIHPERKSKLKTLFEKVKIRLGIRKSYIHAAYIMYLYKIYDILSTISSYVIELGKNIELGKEVKEEKTAEKLEKKAEKSAHVVGLKDKALGYLGDKIKLKIFKEAKNRIETLDESISINLENYKKLLDSIKEGNDKLNVHSYKFWISSDAMQKLVDYFGDKFRGSGEWIEVTVQYTGGAYHKAANPLKKIDISGFSGNTEETAEFIGAVLALSDKLIIDRVGEQEFESPLVIIDLHKIKLLSYKSKTFIDKFIAPIKALVHWIIKLITRKTKKKGELDPTILGSLMFEAYISIKGIKPIGTKEKEAQDKENEEEIDNTEEKGERVDKKEEEIDNTEEKEEEADKKEEQRQKRDKINVKNKTSMFGRKRTFRTYS